MSSCLASALTTSLNGKQKLASSSAARSLLSGRVARGTRRRTSARSASTSGTSSSSEVTGKTLTALHKTRSFAFGVLKSRHQNEVWESWNKLLEQAQDDLSALRAGDKEGNKARVLVYGYDEHSGSKDMLTALLELHIESEYTEEEPIPIEVTQNDLIRNRWTRAQKAVVIERPAIHEPHIETPSPLSDHASQTVKIGLGNSPFFDRFETDLRLTEIAPCPAGDSGNSHRRMFSEVSQKLFGADVPVLVCNPLTTSLTTFVNRDLPVPLSPNAIIIFVSPSTSTEVRAQIISYISQVQHERLHPSSFSTIAEAEGEGPVDLPLRILFVDPARALGAVRTLQKNPSSPKAVEKYQADFTGSNISAFTEALKEVIEPSYPPRAASKDTSIVRLRAQTAQTIAEGALQACRNSLYLEEQEIASLESELGSLEKLVAAVKGSLPQEVLGLKSESGDEVVQALEEAEEALKEVIGRLTWWRATWRVDEVGQIVAAAVERHWCKRLEDRLIYHAGRLMALQGELKTSTDSVLASHVHPSPFDSPVLRNALAQLSSSPSYPINPHVLTSPLTSRLMQITQYPTTRLHLSAQRMVLGLSGSAVSGVGLGLAGWGGYLNSGPLAWVLGYGSMEPMTAVGVGALVGVAGMRWAVGRWERAKKAWWKDWRRVGEGLDRDLRAHLDRTIREQVVVIPEKACGELGGMVERRKASLEKSLNDLQDMRDDLRSLHPERDAKAG